MVSDSRLLQKPYGTARNRMWNVTEKFARWALKEITGQEFRSGREWDAWLDKNRKEYCGK